MGLQYGIKEIMNCTIQDFVTGNQIAYVDYADVSTQTIKAVRTDIRGGVGGYKLMSFDSQKDLNFTLSLPLVDVSLLAMLVGDTLGTSVAANVFQREVLVVDGSNSITLSQTPVGDPSVSTLLGTRDIGTAFTKTALTTPGANEYKVTGKSVQFNTAVTQGTKIVVVYQYATTGSKKFSIKANKFASTVSINGDALFRNEETDTDQAVKVSIFKARPKADIAITMDMANPTKLSLDFDLYPIDVNGDKVLIDYVIL